MIYDIWYDIDIDIWFDISTIHPTTWLHFSTLVLWPQSDFKRYRCLVDVEGQMGQHWHAISTTQSCKLREGRGFDPNVPPEPGHSQKKQIECSDRFHWLAGFVSKSVFSFFCLKNVMDVTLPPPKKNTEVKNSIPIVKATSGMDPFPCAHEYLMQVAAKV